MSVGLLQSSAATVHGLFAQRAAAHPDAVALVYRGQRIRYVELDARATSLAQRLIGAGVRPRTNVGLLLDHEPDVVVAVLAVLKAGAAYTVLDPRQPARRNAGELAAAGASAVITMSVFAAEVIGTSPVVVVDDESATAMDSELPHAEPDDPACLVFTSGSAGRSTEVLVSHRELVARLTVESDEVRTLCAPRSCDAFGPQMWGPLLSGAIRVHKGGTTAAVSVPAWIAAVANDVPDAAAVVSAHETITYRELLDRADRIAGTLLRHGVGPDTVVGVLLPRGPRAVITLLGVHRAGAAYLPLDPGHPDAHLRQLAVDARADVVLAEANTADRAGDIAGPAPVLRVEDALMAEPDHVEPDPDDLAYVIYTSGSTGQPKGVAVTFDNLANLVAAQRAELSINAGDRVLQYASLGFDASVWEIFATWSSGATSHIAADDERLGGALLDRLRGGRITLATLTPTALASLPPRAPAELSDLATLVSAGEPCPPTLVDAWAHGRTFINAYGPTETTVCASMARLQPADPPLIGNPLPGVRVHVLDRWLRQVPCGVIGEIYVGGPAVARGYVHDPKLTSTRFLPDPFADVPGQRMYRTGDLGQWSPAGLRYRGRFDAQLKHNGVRIEAAHVEAVLTEFPSVAQAAVVVRTDEQSGSRLLAYLVAVPGRHLDVTALRGHARARLPVAMVPDRFVRLLEMPLSASGKVDRRALPVPSDEPVDTEITGLAPGTDLERQIAEVWADVLHLPRIGVHDDFFELGGNSLCAVRASARLADLLRRHVSVSHLLAAPTVARLAETILGDPSAPAPAALAPIPRLRRTASRPDTERHTSSWI